MKKGWLFSFLIIVTFSSCGKKDGDIDEQAIVNCMIEESIAEYYRPENEYQVPPGKGKIVDHIQLEGTWSNPGEFSYTSITFEKRCAGNYGVKFYSGGCEMEWTLDREATYKKGVITFDKPVEEYLPALYTRMYTIQFNETVYLLASERIEDFEEENDSNGETWLLKKNLNPVEEQPCRIQQDIKERDRFVGELK